MFWTKRNKLVHLQRLNRSARQKKSQGHGQDHMEIRPSYYVIKGDQRKKTCTVREYHKGKLQVKYRTVPLAPAQFDSLMAAMTVPEVDNILKQVDYYVIR